VSFLRAAKGYTRHDQLRNEDIRIELGVEPIQDKLSNYRENWKTHLQHVPEERMPKQIVQYQPRDRRTVGRPWKRWNKMWDRNTLWRNSWRMMMMMTTLVGLVAGGLGRDVARRSLVGPHWYNWFHIAEFLEKVIVYAVVKKLPAFYETRSYITGSWGSSVSIVSDCRLYDWNLITGGGKGFFL
jgi:hypothetical protein